jgi:hypothetical protein
MGYLLAYNPYNTNLFMRSRNLSVYLTLKLETRIKIDGGVFEAESCLETALTKLNSIS